MPSDDFEIDGSIYGETEPAQNVSLPATQSFEEMLAARRARATQTPVAVVSEIQQAMNTVTVTPVTDRIQAGNVVAGSASEGHGVLLGWIGQGEVTYSRLMSVVNQSGAFWHIGHLPERKSAHAQAGHVLTALHGSGYVVRSAHRGRSPREGTRDYKNKWYVGLLDRAATVGDKFGTVVITVKLTHSDYLVVDFEPGYDAQARKIQDDFDQRRANEVFTSSEITMWLRSTLVRYCKAVRLGGMWYIPHRYVERAVPLCTELAKVYGADWVLPAIPVATSDELRRGLANSFIKEAREVLDESKEDLGERAAASLVTRLTEVGRRAKSMHDLLGDAELEAIRVETVQALDKIREAAGYTAVRGALIWDEIRRDNT